MAPMLVVLMATVLPLWMLMLPTFAVPTAVVTVVVVHGTPVVSAVLVLVVCSQVCR